MHCIDTWWYSLGCFEFYVTRLPDNFYTWWLPVIVHFEVLSAQRYRQATVIVSNKSPHSILLVLWPDMAIYNFSYDRLYIPTPNFITSTTSHKCPQWIIWFYMTDFVINLTVVKNRTIIIISPGPHICINIKTHSMQTQQLCWCCFCCFCFVLLSDNFTHLWPV